MISQLMTGTAHEGGRSWMGGYWSFPRPAPMIWVTVYDPLRGVPVAELEVTKSEG